jgi:hypothetical protein
MGRFLPIVMVVERGGCYRYLVLERLNNKNSCMERQKCAPRYILSKGCPAVMCCGNAFGNHKLKLVVIRKAKKPRSFKCTEANCIPVH